MHHHVHLMKRFSLIVAAIEWLLYGAHICPAASRYTLKRVTLPCDATMVALLSAALVSSNA